MSMIATELYMNKRVPIQQRVDPLNETLEMIYIHDTCVKTLNEKYQLIPIQDEQKNPFTM